ncbi:testis-expressed protein 50 [Rhinopithecus roxellana]|uniref:Testis expressed 50 n=1 Tax=Rhinopithecus roxellana TaxID=61622 RepID=A0A2K6RP82_RHIRO|nr:testis-expressed protein 50 [Rhinopithecus roxellana]
MSNQGLSLIFSLLLICFFGESFCICDRTIWAKVGWEILPEEVHNWKFKCSPSHRLPYLLDKLCCDFANMDIFHGCLYLIYNLLQALFFILFVLSVHYLWMKWKKHQKKLKNQASLEKPGNDLESPFIYNIDKTLYRVATTASAIYKIWDHRSYHPSSKKIKHCKLKKKSKEEGARRH